jgi:hypothetical protein
MLAELDGKTVERTGVQALEEAFDDELGAQVEPGNLADYVWLEVFFGGGHEGNVESSMQRRTVSRNEIPECFNR